ncbi:uncharacterized protein LOC107271983 [Cephus cinctus]|uniref:Uncharacterized protein LOC107271983 n=1 Tax=Cephus cinctus TaxID=211228 RepID=A0AAJ7RQ03_CEPCN|nr:uncharacterized protein LOC107271983 [Cephus cinctus]
MSYTHNWNCIFPRSKPTLYVLATVTRPIPDDYTELPIADNCVQSAGITRVAILRVERISEGRRFTRNAKARTLLGIYYKKNGKTQRRTAASLISRSPSRVGIVKTWVHVASLVTRQRIPSPGNTTASYTRQKFILWKESSTPS